MPEEGSSSSSKNIVTQKVGPFPLWGWAAIAGAAIGVLMIVRRQSGTSYTPGQTPTVSAGGLGVTSADPLTAQQLLDQMSTLTTALQSTVNPQQITAAVPSAGQLQLASLAPDPRGFAVWNFDANNQGILGYLPAGTIITYLREATGFNGEQGWLVQYGNKVAWISGSYVGAMGPPASPKPGPPQFGVPSMLSGTAGSGLNLARAGVPPPFAAPGAGHTLR